MKTKISYDENFVNWLKIKLSKFTLILSDILENN